MTITTAYTKNLTDPRLVAILNGESTSTTVAATFAYTDTGRPLSITVPSTGTYSYHYDQFGNVERLAGSNGVTAARYTYDMWGRELATKAGPAWNVDVDAINPFRAVGAVAGIRQDDSLIQIGGLTYAPATGRAISTSNAAAVSPHILDLSVPGGDGIPYGIPQVPSVHLQDQKCDKTLRAQWVDNRSGFELMDRTITYFDLTVEWYWSRGPTQDWSCESVTRETISSAHSGATFCNDASCDPPHRESISSTQATYHEVFTTGVNHDEYFANHILTAQIYFETSVVHKACGINWGEGGHVACGWQT